MKIILSIAFCLLSVISYSQTTEKLYHPQANAENDINLILQQAKAQGKYVLLQGGGNWCSWCIKFAAFCKKDSKIDSLISANFIWYHLNFSKENQNKILFAKYGYAQRFGFPVFIILNEKGERIHTQNSEYLEDGKKSYDSKKVFDFLSHWSPKALDPKQY